MALGVEWDLNRDTRICEVCGISTITELPVKIAVTGEIVAQALNPILYRIFSGITSVIQMTPPAILGDIREHGIVLIGGVAQLKGLKRARIESNRHESTCGGSSFLCKCSRRRICLGVYGLFS